MSTIGIIAWAVVALSLFRCLGRRVYYEEQDRDWASFLSAVTLGGLAAMLWPVWILPALVFWASKGDPDRLARVTLGGLSEDDRIKQLERRSHELDKWLDESDAVEVHRPDAR